MNMIFKITKMSDYVKQVDSGYHVNQYIKHEVNKKDLIKSLMICSTYFCILILIESTFDLYVFSP